MTVASLGKIGDGLNEDASESLVEIAYQQIEEMIVTMELKPGSRVSEPFLVERLKLGRTPIREALVKLAMDQLLIWLPRRGMVVRDINLQTQLKVLEMRRALELVLVSAAARRRSHEEALAIHGIVERFRSLRGDPDHVKILALDREFISTFITVSRNPFLRAIVPLYALSRRFWLSCEAQQSRFKPEVLTDFHMAIGTAVANGDEAEAQRQTTAFLDYIEEFTRYVGTELS